MADQTLGALADALAEARILLERHGEKYVSRRLRDLEARARRGDAQAAVGAVSESTGSMGSLNDRILRRHNGDAIDPLDELAVNSELQLRVRSVEQAARSAAAAHGLELVR